MSNIIISRKNKTISYKQKKYTKSYELQISNLEEQYKGHKVTKKILETNAIHYTKMMLGHEIVESYIKDIWGAQEIPNYSLSAKGFLVLDMLTGAEALNYLVITLRADGVQSSNTVPWTIFKIANDVIHNKYLNNRVAQLKDILINNIIEKFGITFKEDPKTKVKIDLELPYYGKIISVVGDIDGLIEFEIVRIQDNQLKSYIKLMYLKKSDSFEFVNTTHITPELTLMMSNTFDMVQDLNKKFGKSTKTQKNNISLKKEEEKNE